MATRSAAGLTRPPVARLLSRLQPPSPPPFAAFSRSAAAEGRAILSTEAGRFLEALAVCRPDGKILELGCGTGGATYWLAKGASRASIVAADRALERLNRARALLGESGLGANVEWFHGDARDVLESVTAPLDLVVIEVGADVGADEARRLVDLTLPKLAVGGRIAVLGALRDLVDDGLAAVEVAALERLRPYLLIHPQLASSIVPIGEGVLLSVKRRETIRELGGPF